MTITRLLKIFGKREPIMAKPRKKPSLLIPILLLITALLILLVGTMVYTLWCDSQLVFHDVTMELGRETLDIRDFLTPLGNPGRASFVTDPSTIDYNKVGRSSLTLRHGTQTAVVNLNIVDTTPPTVVFLREYTASVVYPLPQAGALVTKSEDFSPLRVYYAKDPVIPDDYSDTTVTVVVEDTSGNKVEGHCVLHFTGWLKETCTLELGQSLTPDMLLTNPEKDGDLLNKEELKKLSATLGEHTLIVSAGNASAQCVITVADTTAPTLVLKNVHVLPGRTPKITDFVVTAKDFSGEPVVSFVEELPDPYAEGAHNISVEARDSSGNVTRAEAILWISGDWNPPTIRGAQEDMTVKKGSKPDFLKGVAATDDIDGACDITVDLSELDLTKEGSYSITYSAIDHSGNMAVCHRKVIVE